MFNFIEKILGKKKPDALIIEKIISGWSIEILAGKDKGRKIELKYNYIPIGRIDKNIRISEYEIRFEDQTVSYNQAHLCWHAMECHFSIVHDREPAVNYTYVNKNPVPSRKKVILHNGDIVAMGNIVFSVKKDFEVHGNQKAEIRLVLNKKNGMNP